MKKQYPLGLGMAVIASIMLIAFNNCAEDVAFNDYTLDEDSEQQLLNNIPNEELEMRRPLSDLESNPELIKIYACGGGGVAICHFPENVESQATQCVGLPSVKTHYDHIRDYDLGAGPKTTSDYLGPCRFPL